MAFERITQKDWYQILGAKPSDSPAELKRKYQKLALLYHPDKQKADVPAGEVEERVQRFIEIDQAWKILGNEETKKEYDLQQREDNLTKEWPLHAQIYLEDMSWNEGMSALQLVPGAFQCHCKRLLFFLHLIPLCCLIVSSTFFHICLRFSYSVPCDYLNWNLTFRHTYFAFLLHLFLLPTSVCSTPFHPALFP
ncbi:dnaJ homolog subfamily C member 24 isoform X1 [Chroicocephalus ridibundus]|uniref:dnaJ homolog subfamily C member 24 isoform X1 n=1 Tax=Chroicocephalus ridibundus TaxID=1192867 RepID=UPI002FDCC76B